MGLVNTGIKSTPCVQCMQYFAVLFMLWAYISAGGPGHLIYTHGIIDSIKYQHLQKSISDRFC